MWLIQTFWPIFLALFLFQLVMTLLSSFIEVFNLETDEDTDKAVINAAAIIDLAISNEDFRNEILDMINENANIEDIYNKIEDKLKENGMSESDAKKYKEQVLDTIKTYNPEASSEETSSVVNEYYGCLSFA